MKFAKKRCEFVNFATNMKEKRVKGFEKFEKVKKFKKAKNPSPNERTKQINEQRERERERERE